MPASSFAAVDRMEDMRPSIRFNNPRKRKGSESTNTVAKKFKMEKCFADGERRILKANRQKENRLLRLPSPDSQETKREMQNSDRTLKYGLITVRGKKAEAENRLIDFQASEPPRSNEQCQHRIFIDANQNIFCEKLAAAFGRLTVLDKPIPEERKSTNFDRSTINSSKESGTSCFFLRAKSFHLGLLNTPTSSSMGIRSKNFSMLHTWNN
uniref:Uncharacterized protein n=1 Tax=Panagrolaimus davidi TaxID=227884 RepID=A0A914PGL9_9BILA